MSGRYPIPTPEEDAAIAQAIADDPDTVDIVDGLEKGYLVPRRVGRPRADRPKRQLTLRLDAEVIEHFRATGDGWQGRMNAALRKAAGL